MRGRKAVGLGPYVQVLRHAPYPRFPMALFSPKPHIITSIGDEEDAAFRDLIANTNAQWRKARRDTTLLVSISKHLVFTQASPFLIRSMAPMLIFDSGGEKRQAQGYPIY